MLEVIRQNSRSPWIKVIFTTLIAAFVLTFYSGSRLAASLAESAAEPMLEVGGVTVDGAELELAMRLSPEAPPPGANGFEKLQASQRYEKLRLPYTGGGPEMAQLTTPQDPIPVVSRQKVANELVEALLVAEEAKKLGLGVSDNELARRVMALEKVFGISFRDENGAFDPKKYDNFARFSLGTSKTLLENFLRREIMRDKVAQIVTGGIQLTPQELDALLDADAKRTRLEIVALDAETVAGAVVVADADADAYVAAHEKEIADAFAAKAETYQVPDRWNVRGILVSKGEGDKKAAADAIRADLDKAWKGETVLDPVAEEGADAPPADGKKATDLTGDEKSKRLLGFFSKVASEKTEHNITKDNGGNFVDDLSPAALARSPFGQPVADAVKTAEVGTLVGPVETETGYWILAVEKKLPGKTTVLDATIKRELAQDAVRKERAAAELDKFASSVLEAAAATPTTALAEVIKKWNVAHGGKEDGPLTASTTPPLGKSPMEALNGGMEALLGLPPKADDPDDIPGIGKSAEVAAAARKLKADKPVAGQVFKSEDGKTRYVVRRANSDAQTPEADAKVKESLGRLLTQARKVEAWHGFVKKLWTAAEAAKSIKFTEQLTTAVAEEKKRYDAAAKRNADAGGGASPLGIQMGSPQVEVGGQKINLEAAPAAEADKPAPADKAPDAPKPAEAPAK